MKAVLVLYLIGSLCFLAGTILALTHKPEPVPLRCNAMSTYNGVTYRCGLAAQHAYGHYGEDERGFMAWPEKKPEW